MIDEAALVGDSATHQGASMLEPLPSDDHSRYSSVLEKIIEHIFIGDVLRHLWATGERDIEVLRAEVDAGGYDIVIECRGVLRHIQLKASRNASSTRRVNINARLCAKPSGCVIWIRFDPTRRVLGPFLWLGSAPGEPLADISGFKRARHNKANSQGIKLYRANSYEIRDVAFETVPNLPLLLDKMFGERRATEVTERLNGID